MKKLVAWWSRRRADRAVGRIIYRRMRTANGQLGPEFETLSMNTPYLDMIRFMVMLADAAPVAALRLAHAIDAFDQQPHVLAAEASFEEAISRTRQRANRGEQTDLESEARVRTFRELERARYSPESRKFLLRTALKETQRNTATAEISPCDGDQLREVVSRFVEAATKWET